MSDDAQVLTNTAAATRLRALLHQTMHEPPALDQCVVHTLTPAPEERLWPSGRPDVGLENP